MRSAFIKLHNGWWRAIVGGVGPQRSNVSVDGSRRCDRDPLLREYPLPLLLGGRVGGYPAYDDEAQGKPMRPYTPKVTLSPTGPYSRDA
jgi:hypothetical protein